MPENKNDIVNIKETLKEKVESNESAGYTIIAPVGFTLFYDKDNIPYTNEGIMQGIINHMNYSGGYNGGGYNGGPGNYENFNFIPSGDTPFKGMSDAQKFQACGITHRMMTGTEVKNAGLLTKVALKQTRGIYTGLINKAVANDLSNICVEICKLGFFDMQISNTFREQNTVKGAISKHCWGVALDINPTRGCPWFATHIPRFFCEPAPGSRPPWGFKKYSCGGYDRSKCIWSYDHPVVKIFEAHGWGWGGRYGDTMHFSLFNGS